MIRIIRMRVTTFDVGGMYSAGKTTLIQEFLEKLPEPELITKSKYCNIVHNDRSGIKRIRVDGFQIIIANEWVTNNYGRIVYEQVVGPKTNPFMSELVFLYQEVKRFLVTRELCRERTLVINDLSFWDSYKMFVPAFHEFNKGVPGKCFDETVSGDDIKIVRDVLGLDLKEYSGMNKITVLKHFYSNPHLITSPGDGKVTVNDLKPDAYLILTVNPEDCVLRATRRARDKIRELGEDDIRYPSILKRKAEEFYEHHKNKWNLKLVNTSSVSVDDLNSIFQEEILSLEKNIKKQLKTF